MKDVLLGKDDNVNKILRRHRLSYVGVIKASNIGFDKTVVIKTKGLNNELFSLKICLSSDVYVVKRFVKEIINTQKIRKELPNRYKDFIPNVKWASLKKEKGYYYVYKYIEGRSISEFIKDYGIKTGVFNKTNFNEFTDMILSLYDLHVDGVKPLKLSKLLKEHSTYLKRNVKFCDNKLLLKINKYLENNGLNITNNGLVYMDLYPENILVDNKRNLFLIDFEHINQTSVAFIAAFLYLLFWREGYWKARVYSKFYNWYMNKYDMLPESNNCEFNVEFSYFVVLIGVRLIYQLARLTDKSNENLLNARKSVEYDISGAISGNILTPHSIKFYICDADLSRLAKEYKLGKIVKSKVFYASHGNSVVFVATNRLNMIFRFYSDNRSNCVIENEMSVIKKLGDNGITTHKIIKNQEGQDYTNIFLYGKIRRVSVLTYVKGYKIRKRWATETTAFRLGENLRRIHDLDIIHGDYSKENILFYKGSIQGVIDFEWSKMTTSRSDKLLDLVKAITLWVVDIREKLIPNDVFVLNFISGYFSFLPDNKIILDLLNRIIVEIENEQKIFASIFSLKNTGSRFIMSIDDITKMKNNYSK